MQSANKLLNLAHWTAASLQSVMHCSGIAVAR
jgi:hypothetical protein